jgi:hypothetical protein
MFQTGPYRGKSALRAAYKKGAPVYWIIPTGIELFNYSVTCSIYWTVFSCCSFHYKECYKLFKLLNNNTNTEFSPLIIDALQAAARAAPPSVRPWFQIETEQGVWQQAGPGLNLIKLLGA